MDGKQWRRFRPELEVLLKRYLPLFGRKDNHAHAVRFVHGLFDGSDRRNTENIAEAVAGGVPRTLQKFITQGVWDAGDVLGEVRAQVTVTVDLKALGLKGKTIAAIDERTGKPIDLKDGILTVPVMDRNYTLVTLGQR